jgi:hypothetical protein
MSVFALVELYMSSENEAGSSMQPAAWVTVAPNDLAGWKYSYQVVSNKTPIRNLQTGIVTLFTQGVRGLLRRNDCCELNLSRKERRSFASQKTLNWLSRGLRLRSILFGNDLPHRSRRTHFSSPRGGKFVHRR